MANSTLRPGRPSDAIVKLRDAAIRDMEAPDLNVSSVRVPDFDYEHDSVNSHRPEEIPTFHGTDNPHVGNGRGPIG